MNKYWIIANKHVIKNPMPKINQLFSLADFSTLLITLQRRLYELLVDP